MDSKIGALAVAVMKNSKEVQAENEKLIGLVADQVRQFKALEASMPALKKEAFDEFYKLAENIKAELTDIAAFNAKSAVESNYRAMGERNAVYLGELTAKIDAAKKALLEQIKPEIIKETDASVRGYLASAEGAEKVRNAIEKNAGPLLAAFESSGTAFIDAYQGTFKPGVSKAKRGQLWTFYGNTVLCTADTNKEPVAFGTTEKMKNWVIVAASGAPGASVVSSGGGGGSVSAWGDLTGTLSAQADLQSALDAKQDAGNYAAAGTVSALSSNALVLAEKEWPIKTVTWATNQTLTYTGGLSDSGFGVVIAANVTTQFSLTVTPTSCTIYRNGSVSALSGTITVPVGKHRFVFWTPDDGTTLYMEDTVFSATDVPVALTATNYTAASPNVEAHLTGINTALAGGTWTSGILFTTGSTSPVISNSIAETSIFSGTVPANVLASGKAIKFSLYALYLNDTGNTSGMNFKLKFGSDVIWADSGNSTWFSTNSGTHVMLISGELKGSSSTVQYGYGKIDISSALGATTGYGDATGASTGSSLGVQFGGVTSSVDSTSSQTLDFLITLTGAAGASTSHKVTVLSGICWKL